MHWEILYLIDILIYLISLVDFAQAYSLLLAGDHTMVARQISWTGGAFALGKFS